MGFISFNKSPDITWSSRSFVVRQVLQDAASAYPDDKELAEAVDMADAYDGLSMELLPSALALRITDAVARTVNDTLDGTVVSGIKMQPFYDPPTDEMYMTALLRLRQTIEEARTFRRKEIVQQHQS